MFYLSHWCLKPEEAAYEMCVRIGITHTHTHTRLWMIWGTAMMHIWMLVHVPCVCVCVSDYNICRLPTLIHLMELGENKIYLLPLNCYNFGSLLIINNQFTECLFQYIHSSYYLIVYVIRVCMLYVMATGANTYFIYVMHYKQFATKKVRSGEREIEKVKERQKEKKKPLMVHITLSESIFDI